MLKKFWGQVLSGVAAGLMILIGCCVYAACNIKWVGAVLFSAGLLTVCIFGFSLYTGRIGFILTEHSKNYISELLLGLVGNVLISAALGIILSYAIPSIYESSAAICAAKLGQKWWQTLIRGIMCGVLMYVAVAVYKEKKSYIGIVFCIPVFILSGFEHSIADIGYFALGRVYSAKAFGFIMLVLLGNSIGALILPAIRLVMKEKVKKADDAKSGNVGNCAPGKIAVDDLIEGGETANIAANGLCGNGEESSRLSEECCEAGANPIEKDAEKFSDGSADNFCRDENCGASDGLANSGRANSDYSGNQTDETPSAELITAEIDENEID